LGTAHNKPNPLGLRQTRYLIRKTIVILWGHDQPDEVHLNSAQQRFGGMRPERTPVQMSKEFIGVITKSLAAASGGQDDSNARDRE
tara:strand:- start:454 stop:711 length:258 start_codon:yes stop_codon:yes gene_type:complete